MSELKRFAEETLQIANQWEHADKAITTRQELDSLKDFLIQQDDNVLKYWTSIENSDFSYKNWSSQVDIKKLIEFNTKSITHLLKKYKWERSLTKEEVDAVSKLFDGLIWTATEYTSLLQEYKTTIDTMYADLVESAALYSHTQEVGKWDYINEWLRKQRTIVKKLFYHDGGVVFTNTQGDHVPFKQIENADERAQIAELVDQGLLVNLSSVFRLIEQDNADFMSKSADEFWTDERVKSYQHLGKKLDKKQRKALLFVSEKVKSSAGYVKQTVDALRDISLMPVSEQRDSQVRALRRYFLTKKRLQETKDLSSLPELESMVFDLNLDNSLDDSLTMSESQLSSVFWRAYTTNGWGEDGKRKTRNNLLQYKKMQTGSYQYPKLTGWTIDTDIASVLAETDNKNFYPALGKFLKKYPVFLNSLHADFTTLHTQKIFDILVTGDEATPTIAKQYEQQAEIDAWREQNEKKLISEALDDHLAWLSAGIEKTLEALPADDPRREELRVQTEAVQNLSSLERQKIVFQLHGVFGVLTTHQGKTLLSWLGTAWGASIDLKNNIAQYLDVSVWLMQGMPWAKKKDLDMWTSGVLAIWVRSAYLVGKKKNVTLFRWLTWSVGVNRSKTDAPVNTTLSPQALLLWGTDVNLTAGSSFVINGDRLNWLGGTAAKSVGLGVSASLIHWTLSAGVSYQRDKKTGIERDNKALQDLLPSLVNALANSSETSFQNLYTLVENIFFSLHPKYAKKQERRNFKAWLEQLTTVLQMKLQTYRQAYQQLKDWSKDTSFLTDEFVTSIVTDCRNLAVDELGDGMQSLHISWVGVSVVVLPTPAVVWWVTMSWYGATQGEVSKRSVQHAEKKLESGTTVHMFPGTLAANIDRYNAIINNEDGNKNEILDEKSKLQHVKIWAAEYCAIPKWFADKVTVWNGFSAVAWGIKNFCVRYEINGEEMILLPAKTVTALHVFEETRGARFVFVAGDRGVNDINEFHWRTQIIDTKINRESIVKVDSPIAAVDVLDSYDVDVMRSVEKQKYEQQYKTELSNQIEKIKTTYPTYPLDAVISLSLDEKPLSSATPPSKATVVYSVKPEAKSAINKVVWPEWVVYDDSTGQLTVQLPATLNLFRDNQGDYKPTYDTSGTDRWLGFATVDNFEASAEGTEQMVSAELPKEFVTFLSSKEASALWMKIRYDDKLTLSTDDEDTGKLYEDYHAAIEKGNYAEAKRLVKGVLQTYIQKFDSTLSVDTWLDLDTPTNKEQAVAVLHQIDGELSRVRHTEFKHETAAQAKVHAQGLLASLQYSEGSPVYAAVMAIIDAPAWSRVATFEQHKKLLARELKMQYGINGYNGSLLVKDKARFDLGHLVRPDYDIMAMRDEAFAQRIVNSKWYTQDLAKTDVALSLLVEQRAKDADAMFAPDTGNGTGTREIGNMVLVATFHGNRQTGYIWWKPVFNPTLVPGTEVSVNNEIKNATANKAYKERFLRDKYEKNTELLKFEIDRIRADRQKVIANNPWKEVIFWWNENDLPKQWATIAQLIAFKLNTNRSTLDIIAWAYGPCKNYCKKEIGGLKYTVITKTDLKTTPVPVTVMAVQTYDVAWVAVHTIVDDVSRNQSNFTAGMVFTKWAPAPEETESHTNPDEWVGTNLEVEPWATDGLVFTPQEKPELWLPPIETMPGTFVPQQVESTWITQYNNWGKTYTWFFWKDNDTGREYFYVTQWPGSGANIGTQNVTNVWPVRGAVVTGVQNFVDIKQATQSSERKKRKKKTVWSKKKLSE